MSKKFQHCIYLCERTKLIKILFDKLRGGQPLTKKSKSKPTNAKTKEVKTKKTGKAVKAEKGERYYCEVCGCEIACIKPSAEAVVCCDEPMLLVCE